MLGWRALTAWISGAALFLVGHVSAAEERTPTDETPAALAARCTPNTAIDLLACQIAAQLPRARKVAVSYGDTTGASQLHAVSAKLQAALAQKLRGKPHVHSLGSVLWPLGSDPNIQVVEYPGPQAKGEVAKRTHEGQQVHLELSLNFGTLNVRVSVFSAERGGFWDRIRNQTAAIQVFVASASSDPSVRTLLPSASRPASIKLAESFPLGPEPPIALACEYNEKRDGVRIAFVGRQSVWVEELSGGKLATKKRWPWAKLSEVAPVPLREPLASVDFAPDGSVHAGLTDRRFMLRLSLSDDSMARWEGRLPWPSIGCLERTGLGLGGLSTGCPSATKASTRGFELSGVVDAVAGAHLITAEGKRKVFGAVRNWGAGVALLFGVQDAPLQVAGVGSSLALGDLDGDGAPEFLNSLPTFSPKEDALEVRWLDNLSAPRLRFPVEDGVVAVAVCPWLGGPSSPVLVLSKSRLLVFR
ncbi:MAG: hypothetical protein SFV15_12180 [Polyangiaceae bacterium]|nr:hypothetical protein [Polyangiaceae bacterium]